MLCKKCRYLQNPLLTAIYSIIQKTESMAAVEANNAPVEPPPREAAAAVFVEEALAEPLVEVGDLPAPRGRFW